MVTFLSTRSKIAWDTETTGVGRFDNICGICAASDGRSYYVPIRHEDPPYNAEDYQTSLFENSKIYDPIDNMDPELVLDVVRFLTDIPAIFHNATFDLRMFAQDGIPEHEWKEFHDTFLIGFLRDERLAKIWGGLKLEGLAERHLGIKAEGEEKLKQWALDHGATKSKWKAMMRQIPVQLVYYYGCEDVEQTYELFHHEDFRIARIHFESLYHTELKVMRAAVNMMLDGIPVDEEWALKYYKELTKEYEEIEKECREITEISDFNPLSGEQLALFLMSKGFKVRLSPSSKKNKQEYVTDKLALSRIDHPICDKIIRARWLSKTISTYVEPFIPGGKYNDNGMYYPDWRTVKVKTGRFSAKLTQLIPKHDPEAKKICRGIFRNPDTENKIWVGFDFSQLQLRIAAHVSKDPKMLSIYRDGGDIHRLTASIAYNIKEENVTSDQRFVAKGLNFGNLFGSGPDGLRKQLEAQGVHISYDQAKKICRNFRKGYRSTQRMNSYLRDQAYRRRCLYNRFGRRNWMRNRERKATSFMIQSLEADLMKIVLCRLYDLLQPYKSKILAQIHDEVIIEFDKSELDDLFFPVIDLMQRWNPPYDWRVPIRVGITYYKERWYEETEETVDESLQKSRDKFIQELKDYIGASPTLGELIVSDQGYLGKKFRDITELIDILQQSQKYLRYWVPLNKLWVDTGRRVYLQNFAKQYL